MVNPYGKNLVPQTVVTIRYDVEAEVKEYRVGNSGWMSYEGSFIVSENMVVEARASKKEHIYDQDDNLRMKQ